jgi:hypothetical protein
VGDLNGFVAPLPPQRKFFKYFVEETKEKWVFTSSDDPKQLLFPQKIVDPSMEQNINMSVIKVIFQLFFMY